ncbi:hypothetical protein RHO14_10655 [Orbus wheelerorum]|uniref:hypothetical protein n=1 Tax=Orbus wheelerorum TaxID=3074111 RepID=UPI00370D2E87
MPSCDGGTIPDKDRKFYLSGIKIECNPSQNDLDKANKNKDIKQKKLAIRLARSKTGEAEGLRSQLFGSPEQIN